MLAVIAPDGAQIHLPPLMLAPGQTVQHPLNRNATGADLSAHWHIRFSSIDDFGMAHDEEKILLLE